jgi:phosphoglycolate phosphatase
MEKIIIFDYDGVIVDSLDAYEKAVVSAFQKNGFDQIDSRKAFLDLFDENFFESVVKLGVPPENIPAIMKELAPMLQSLQGDIEVFNGVSELLAELIKRCKIFIVTSNVTGVVEAYLAYQNITGFEEIIGSDKETSKVKKIENIKAKYPDGEIFYVGDTKGDMIEGKMAGAKTIAVSWGWHSVAKLQEGEPDYIAEKPSDILAIVKNN